MTQNAQGRHLDLELASYDYHLPVELIADRPCQKKGAARLLVYDQQTNQITHSRFDCLHEFLPAQTQLFFNQSRVFPCRLSATKKSGGKVEVFILSLVPNKEGAFKALLKSSGKKRTGEVLQLPAGESATIHERSDEGVFFLKLSCQNLEHYLEQNAGIPIPPYIRGGQADERDREDYQTSFAQRPGSVAAPTAGLHFNTEDLQRLEGLGHQNHFLTLHVGMGTFSPVKSENILHHKMHSESYALEASTLRALKQKNYKLAVGTTSLRALESVRQDLEWPTIDTTKMRSTDIFLYPGVEVRSIDALVTNFHLPKSSLLMLVSSLIGREKTLELYREAIEKQYRFYSYGDGMLIKRKRL